MKSVHLASAGALLALCSALAAQPQTLQRPRDAAPPAVSARAPSVDPGIVTTPPANVDPEVIDRPPPRVDPGMIEKPPAVGNSGDRGAGPREKKSSAADDCRPAVERCRQDSAR